MKDTNEFGLFDDDVWMTNDGRILKMQEISDSHLLNIINFLKGKMLSSISEGYGVLSYLQGEMAIDAVEAQIDLVQDQYEQRIELFREEARKRKLVT